MWICFRYIWKYKKCEYDVVKQKPKYFIEAELTCACAFVMSDLIESLTDGQFQKCRKTLRVNPQNQQNPKPMADF